MVSSGVVMTTSSCSDWLESESNASHKLPVLGETVKLSGLTPITAAIAATSLVRGFLETVPSISLVGVVDDGRLRVNSTLAGLGSKNKL